MTNYASRDVVRFVVLFMCSLVFCFGTYLLIYGSVVIVGVEGLPTPSGKQPQPHEQIKMYQDRFPSVGSGSVVLIFGILIMINSGIAITGITLQDPQIVKTFGFSSFICCFIKLLFVYATIEMHKFNYVYNAFLAHPGPPISVGISIFEVILGLCALTLSKLMKRGDAALYKIQTLPVKA